MTNSSPRSSVFRIILPMALQKASSIVCRTAHRASQPLRRIITLRTIGVAAALLAGGSSVPACFSLREPACAFSCLQPPHRCPEQYTCQADGLCHRDNGVGICTLTPPGDGGGDAAQPGNDGGATADANGAGDGAGG